MKVLWLASWYPNIYEPFNGDFIQRHAKAVATIMPVDVIHVLQLGHKVTIAKSDIAITANGGLREYIGAFKFTKTGFNLPDKIRYNLLYHRFYKRIVTDYIKENGKPDLIHVHVPVKAGLMALELLDKLKIPYIVSEQSSHYEERSPDYFSKRSKYFQRNTKRIFEKAVAVTNVSATIGKTLQSLFNIKNYRTIHNLVDTTRFFYKEQEPHQIIRFLHVSSMSEQKNVAGIMNALAGLNQQFKNWQCTFCGPHTEELITLASSLGIADKLHFTGEIAYTDVALQMQQADYFVLFSNHENFPCVVVEALCCGLPVVSSNAGGVKEAINANNGLIVEVAKEQQLTSALLQLVKTNDTFNRKEIARQAAKTYNADKIAAAFAELYKEALTKPVKHHEKDDR